MAAYDDYVAQLESLRKVSPDSAEFWMARDLREPLGYDRWESFAEVLKRAMDACAGSGVPVENHFRQTTKMVGIGSGAQRQTEDWFLSRYACYLLAITGWVYIGESNDIQRRLLEHISDNSTLIAGARPTGFVFELVPAERRVARQNELIRALGPSCNQMLG